MNLHSITFSVALLVSATAIAQDTPAGAAPAKEDKTDQAATQSGEAARPAAKRRLPRLDNPLDPNRPRKSAREPAKIRPAEQGGTPAENTRKVAPGRTSKPAGSTAEPAKIRPAENAVTPAENTDKVDQDARPEANASGAEGKQARNQAPEHANEQAGKQPGAAAPRRVVAMTVDSMPSAAPGATYGPRLSAGQGGVNVLTNPPTHLPTSAMVPARPLAPASPAIVNSCDAGGCTDTNGVRYQGGVGSTLVGPQGQACRHNGVTMQC